MDPSPETQSSIYVINGFLTLKSTAKNKYKGNSSLTHDRANVGILLNHFVEYELWEQTGFLMRGFFFLSQVVTTTLID